MNYHIIQWPKGYMWQFLPSIWNPTPPTKMRHGMCFKENAAKRVHPFTYFRRKRQSPASLTLTFLQDVWGSVLRPNCRNLLESPLQRRPSWYRLRSPKPEGQSSRLHLHFGQNNSMSFFLVRVWVQGRLKGNSWLLMRKWTHKPWNRSIPT